MERGITSSLLQQKNEGHLLGQIAKQQVAGSAFTEEQLAEMNAQALAREKEYTRQRAAQIYIDLAEKIYTSQDCVPSRAFDKAVDFVEHAIFFSKNYTLPEEIKEKESNA